METKQVSLVNNIGCENLELEGELSETELQQFLNKGWRIADKVKDKKIVVANLVRFGV